MLEGWCLAANAEAKSPLTFSHTVSAVARLNNFLLENACHIIKHSLGRDQIDVSEIGPDEIRAFTVHLQGSPCFERHPNRAPEARPLSGFTVNSYLRAVRAFFSWLADEEIIPESPFTRVRIPRPPRKIIATFSPAQFQALIAAADATTAGGYRNLTILTVLLDTGLRVSELTGLALENVDLEAGHLKVLGKGRKERLIPIGKRSRNLLWNYIRRFRPEPASASLHNVFLNSRGDPLRKNYVEAFMRRYGKKAEIEGVRCSPHTLRHSAAVMFLRNGGDVFSLQRLLGHATLEMTRHYCELADVDVAKAHSVASPADNLPYDRARRDGPRPPAPAARARASTKYLPPPIPSTARLMLEKGTAMGAGEGG